MRPIFWPGCITESLLQPSLLLLGRAAPDNWTSLRRTSLRCSRAFAAEDLPTCEARCVQGDVRRWTASNFVYRDGSPPSPFAYLRGSPAFNTRARRLAPGLPVETFLHPFRLL